MLYAGSATFVKIALFAWLLIFACSIPARAIEPCGQRGPVLEMTIGEIRYNQQPKIVSSAEAIAAIVRTSTVVPVAWILWDQTGTPWLAVKPNSPQILARLVRSSKPIYRNGQFVASGKFIAGLYGMYGRKVKLPTGYELLSCVSVK